MKKRDRGFSLLELLIVVAIILIIATIAIPSLMRSRQAANETAAVATLKMLNTAEVTYSSSTSGAYASIAELITERMIDSGVAGTKAGYNYTIELSGDRLNYTVFATAASSVSGRYDYYTAPDYVLRYTTVTTRAPSGLSGEPVN